MEISDPVRSFRVASNLDANSILAFSQTKFSSARTRPSRKDLSVQPSSQEHLLISSGSMHSIIDGSGTIHDPLGLDRAELIRLAKLRTTISNFDISKLSKDGYRVLVEDRDVVLPCKQLFFSDCFRANFLDVARSRRTCR